VISPVPKNLPVIDTFSGLVPCADCAGIRVQLILFGKRGVKAYRLHEVYVGTPDGDKAVDSEGKAATVAGYEGNPIATVYALNPGDADVARYFLRVDENHLRILNSSKQEIVSRLNYTLTREPPPEPPPTPAPTGESHTS
jgi:copper homeostasis protein (lipoprotein)